MVTNSVSRFSPRTAALLRAAVVLLLFAGFYLLSTLLYFRIDLTSEKRFSVSPPTRRLLQNLDDLVFVRVYLDGNLPSGFVQLKEATRNMLEEFKAQSNGQLDYAFFNPDEAGSDKEKKAIYGELMEKGLAPTNLMVKEDGEQIQKIIFPGAIIGYKGREYPISLLENQIGFSPQEALHHSAILLEYKLIHAIRKLQQYQKPVVGFTSGHGELSDADLSDWQQTLTAGQYEVVRVNLDSAARIADAVQVLIVAGPRYPFTDQQKYKMDQFVMRGGKMLWLLEGTNAQMDSLKKDPTGQFVQNPELNLDDMPYRYGARVNNDLIMDVNLCNPIPLITGRVGNAPQTQLFPWYYFPVFASLQSHAINRNLDPVAGFFCSTVDTVKVPDIRKTILLQSSANSRALLSPARVHLGILQRKPDPASFQQPHLIGGVLLEGAFTSTYKNRVTPAFLAAMDSIPGMKFSEQSPANNKMIVLGDADLARNELRPDGSAYPLGYYRYNGQQFANKDFLMNCVEYLADESGIFETRNKEIKLRLLDQTKTNNEKVFWQAINVVLPIVLLLGAGGIFMRLRKRYYSKD